MRSLAALATLFASARAGSTYTCADDYDYAGDACNTRQSPGPVEAGTFCGCSNGEAEATCLSPSDTVDCSDFTVGDQDSCEDVATCVYTAAIVGDSKACNSHTLCCKKPTCYTAFDDSDCSLPLEPLGPRCTGNNNGLGGPCGLNTGGGACEQPDGFDDDVYNCIFETADLVKAATECEWDATGVADCTPQQCCQRASLPPINCEGSWEDCTSACKVASERTWTTTQEPAHGGSSCPAAGSGKNCFEEPAAGDYDGLCEDTCSAALCTASVTTLVPWATEAKCTGTGTDSNTVCADKSASSVCEAAGCTWMAKVDCDGACTAKDCCVPNKCSFKPRCSGDCELNDAETACTSNTGTDCSNAFQSAEKVISTVGYHAEFPDADTVAGLGFVGCSTGKRKVDIEDGTSKGGWMGQPYNVVVECQTDGGEFSWMSGCTEAANCDGAANLVAAAATCVAKGLAPSCTVADAVAADRTCAVDDLGAGCVATCTATNAADCTSVGQTLPGAGNGCDFNPNLAGRRLDADVELCNAIAGAALADEKACEAVITAASSNDWEPGTCGLEPCREKVDATCQVKDDWTPDTCPTTPCIFTNPLNNAAACPPECAFARQTGQACTYTAAVNSDKIDMQKLGDHVKDTAGDTSCAKIDPEGKLSHFDSCMVTCDDGWHLVESKRDEHKVRISNPKYWRPLHPRCDDGILHYNVACEEDTDWTGVLIIVLVLGFFLVLIPVVKYMQVVGAYNKDKAAGCTWAPDGAKNDPTAASDEAAD